MADKLVYENVPVGVRRRDDNYEVGLVIDGGFFAFGSYKAGGFEDDLAEAQEAQATAKASGTSSTASDTTEG